MFEKHVYRCPGCQFEVREELSDGDSFECPVCRRGFRVMLDEPTGKAALMELETTHVPEPLNLPRGSIRALTALAAAGTCWVMVFTAREVPQSLLSLVLTVLGYYFGFRTKVKSAQGHLFDPTERTSDPLCLPGGVIRWVLIGGSLVSALVLMGRGRLLDAPYFEFFVILLGLVAGYVFGKLLASAKGSGVYVSINNVKGLVVLLAAAALAATTLSGLAEAHPRLLVVLCAVVSFYYGSRQ